jgi:hypothetical protein
MNAGIEKMVDIENIESCRDASKLPSDGGAAKKCPARTPTRLQNRMPISTFPLQRWSKDSYSSTALSELADQCRHMGESDAVNDGSWWPEWQNGWRSK